jgi:ubiquitin C-terminal hydrolase
VHAINKNIMMEVFQQNDINEFISFFIDQMNKDVCYSYKPSKETIIEAGNYSKSPYDVQRYKMDIAWYDKVGDEYSDIINIFYGQSITQIICGHCNNITHNYEIYSSIMLHLDDTTDSLQECLHCHFKDEFLNDENEDNVWKCDECNKRCKSKKTHKLWRNPRILIISLKRFTFNMQKNNKPLRIPMQLSMDEYTLTKDKNIYDLKAVACHIGSYGSGHYFALCKHPDDNWYRIDDLDVGIVKDPDISTGYVYFYALR